MRKFIGSAAALVCGVFSAAALADDQGQVTLFGQLYNVQRFDYSAQLAFQDPSNCNSSGIVNLVMSEGIAFAGNNHAYMCSRDMDIFNTYKHQVIELQFNTDGTGKITGLSFVRSVVRNDTTPTGDPNNCGLGSSFGLNARGLAINTGPTGLGAGGNLIAFSGNEVVHGYDINSGMYLANGGDFNNGWSTSPTNANCDDGTYVPPKNEFYTLDQSPASFVRFTPKGALVNSFSVGAAVTPEPAGDPKGIFFCQDVATFRPCSTAKAA